MEQYYTIIAVVVAVLLDSSIGDPYWLPHPVRLFGNAISLFSKVLNQGLNRRVKGILLWFLLVPTVWAIFKLLLMLIEPYPYLEMTFTAVFFFYGISNRCLIEEGLKVERALQKGDLQGARQGLSMIVGRDTRELSPSKIRSAVIETVSENLSDGVVAPILYFAIGGVPLMMAYKMINTLDSMVGYKNEQYRNFGFFSAKMDDIANLIPARFTALMMVLVSFNYRALRFIFKYGRAHSSPNSGYPESAIAGILNCRLGGPSSYFDKIVDKPYIGDNPREITHKDLIKSCLINAKVALLSVVILMVVLFYFIVVQ